MGDGPGYDHMYAETEQKHARKTVSLHRRLKSLEVMREELGFGERDFDPSAVERMVTDRLREAYELLHLIARPRPR